MILILDGYNVIHAVPGLARHLDHSLEAARMALVNLCKDYRARHKDIERLYVVFDGNEAYAGWPHGDQGGVTVLFTRRQEEADERILSLIRSEKGQGRFLVVSNDTHIFNNARVHGARAISVHEFYAQLHPAHTGRSQRSAVTDKAMLSSGEAQRITEDYRKYLESRTKSRASARPAKPRTDP